MILLHSPQKRAPWPVFQDGRDDPGYLAPLDHTVAGSSFGKPILSGHRRGITRPFHGLFTLPLGTLFNFPSQYYCTIGFGEYLGLPANCLVSSRGISDPRYSRIRLQPMDLRLRGYHPLWRNFHRSLRLCPVRYQPADTLHLPHLSMRYSVCPISPSLAVTNEITIVIFSSAY